MGSAGDEGDEGEAMLNASCPTSTTLISNTSIWHNGVLEGYSPEFNTVQIGSGQVSSKVMRQQYR